MDSPSDGSRQQQTAYNIAIWTGVIEERQYQDGQTRRPMVAIVRPVCLLSAYELLTLPDDFWLGLYDYGEFGNTRPHAGEVWVVLASCGAKGTWGLLNAKILKGRTPQQTSGGDSSPRANTGLGTPQK